MKKGNIHDTCGIGKGNENGHQERCPDSMSERDNSVSKLTIVMGLRLWKWQEKKHQDKYPQGICFLDNGGTYACPLEGPLVG